MKDKKHSMLENVEEDLACTAYAEAGEPCPTGEDKPEHKPDAAPVQGKGEKKSALKNVEEDLACTAFAEAGEPCPVDRKKK